MKVPKGFFFSGIHAGIKKSKKLDVGLVYSDSTLESVCFFTENKVKAAPLILDEKKLLWNKSKIRAIIVNSGNANCFTGVKGIKDAQDICKRTARILGLESRDVLMASTGIIGKRLPMTKILPKLPYLACSLHKDATLFSGAILTTDTFCKVSSKVVSQGRNKIRILGVAKGAGMIYPKLKQATMLGFIFTDANLSKNLLQTACQRAVDVSFNSITVDGCTSTNDSVFILASKRASEKPMTKKDKNFKKFFKALESVCIDLAKKIVQDAEGASKFIKITTKAASEEEAKKACNAIANSNLFKTALYGQSPNWGRIIQALGQAGISVKENVSLKASTLKKKHIEIMVDLKRGRHSWTVYTCDLTPEYIRINAEYS